MSLGKSEKFCRVDDESSPTRGRPGANVRSDIGDAQQNVEFFIFVKYRRCTFVAARSPWR